MNEILTLTLFPQLSPFDQFIVDKLVKYYQRNNWKNSGNNITTPIYVIINVIFVNTHIGIVHKRVDVQALVMR